MSAPRTRRDRDGRSRKLLLGGGSVVASLAVWEAASATGALSEHAMPSALAVLERFAAELGTAEFWTTVGSTMRGWALGLGIAFALAMLVGVPLGYVGAAYRSARAVIEFCKPIPPVTLLPLAVLLYGSSLRTQVLLVAFGAFWPLLVQVIYGVQSTDPVLLETANTFRLGLRRKLVTVVLPSTLPFAATGLRLAAAIALIVAVTVELVAGAPGIGRTIYVAQTGNDLAQMYAYALVAGLLGVALNTVFARAERAVLHWHPTQREGST
jgi:ABC-type nitrate/sulfonate/bicarbonate transport system permease component